MIKKLINFLFGKDEKIISNTNIRVDTDTNPFFEFDQ